MHRKSRRAMRNRKMTHPITIAAISPAPIRLSSVLAPTSDTILFVCLIDQLGTSFYSFLAHIPIKLCVQRAFRFSVKFPVSQFNYFKHASNIKQTDNYVSTLVSYLKL